MTEKTEKSIVNLKKIVNSLPDTKKKLFKKLFSISETKGKLAPPKEMHKWIKSHFGSVRAVKSQKIVKTNNKITYEGALFNELRAKRPMAAKSDIETQKIINENRGDPFCRPLTGTPADAFGRIKGPDAITASNIAKYDGLHGLIIYNEHNPLKFTKANVKNYIELGLKWFKKAHKYNKKAIYPFYMWNCLWKSGASLIHGHSQTVLTKSMHYAKIEFLRKINASYKKRKKRTYFNDLFECHKNIGLGIEKHGVKLFASITPAKEKEIVILADKLNDNVCSAIFHVLKTFKESFSVESFNMAICLKPLVAKKGWEDFPVIVRIIDRGSLGNKTTDVAAMEIFAGNAVIASDPYKVIKEIKKVF